MQMLKHGFGSQTLLPGFASLSLASYGFIKQNPLALTKPAAGQGIASGGSEAPVGSILQREGSGSRGRISSCRQKGLLMRLATQP